MNFRKLQSKGLCLKFFMMSGSSHLVNAKMPRCQDPRMPKCQDPREPRCQDAKNHKLFFYQKNFKKKLFFVKKKKNTLKNYFHQKLFFTKKHLHTKNTQPLYKEKKATSSHKKSRNISTKNLTTSLQKKSCNL